MNREQGVHRIGWMSRGVGESGQAVSGGVSASGWVSGSGWVIRGVGGSGWVSRQVSRCIRQMQRGKRKDDWMWRSKQE